MCRSDEGRAAQVVAVDQEAVGARRRAGGRGGRAARRGAGRARVGAPARRAAQPHAARLRPARRHRARAASRYPPPAALLCHYMRRDIFT